VTEHGTSSVEPAGSIRRSYSELDDLLGTTKCRKAQVVVSSQRRYWTRIDISRCGTAQARDKGCWGALILRRMSTRLAARWLRSQSIVEGAVAGCSGLDAE